VLKSKGHAFAIMPRDESCQRPRPPMIWKHGRGDAHIACGSRITDTLIVFPPVPTSWLPFRSLPVKLAPDLARFGTNPNYKYLISNMAERLCRQYVIEAESCGVRSFGCVWLQIHISRLYILCTLARFTYCMRTAERPSTTRNNWFLVELRNCVATRKISLKRHRPCRAGWVMSPPWVRVHDI
jgi:hypothetical protein